MTAGKLNCSALTLFPMNGSVLISDFQVLLEQYSYDTPTIKIATVNYMLLSRVIFV